MWWWVCRRYIVGSKSGLEYEEDLGKRVVAFVVVPSIVVVKPVVAVELVGLNIDW